MSHLESQFAFDLETLGQDLPQPVPQFRFDPTRRYKADFAWPEHMLLVEVEGGVYTNGRHVRPAGYRKDCEKYNRAQMLGYKVLRYTADMLDDPDAVLDDLRAVLA